MESTLIYLLDLFGTAIFAATGAVKGIRKRLDVFGVCVLGCCVGCGGGMLRDALLGAVPAAALQDWLYLAICIAISLIIFISAKYWMHVRNLIQLGDAIGLGVFTAIGAAKAMNFELGFIGVTLCGVLTACGGGMLRDILVAEIPSVLRSDFYATAALLGGLLFCSLHSMHTPWFMNFLATALFVIALRLVAMKLKVQLPVSHSKRRQFRIASRSTNSQAR